MKKSETDASAFEQADAVAGQYDESALKYGWHSPEVLFGLAHSSLERGAKLLDLGIGTGLSAIPFAKAGLAVHGVDGSRVMLEHCKARGITADLTQHDICRTPLPFSDGSFDHVIACGVFHLIGYLDDIFAEVSRLRRGNGVFAFTVEEMTPGSGDDGVLEVLNEKSGVSSFQHGHVFIQDLLARNGLSIEKTLDYVAYQKTDWADERIFRAYVAR